MKFGGTSLGSAERIRASASLILKTSELRPVAVVVSAMSGVTDLLLDTMKHAEGGDPAGVATNLAEITRRHQAAASELVPKSARSEVNQALDSLITEFERIIGGMLMLGYRPARSSDEAVAIGERLSSVLMSAHLNTRAGKAVAVNAAEIIVTDAVFGNASPVMEQTSDRAHRLIDPLLAKGIIPVITGFNGATIDGRPTTLGRGGSDFSASILAAALDAAELWIWTDVDGIMTADPRLVPDARVLP
jgi:bifunctional aspartokinase / homoserine dehydrogenase 1